MIPGMVEIYVRYLGGLRCVARHAPSGSTLHSDAGREDLRGRAETFSPTDLLTAALGTCMLTVMGTLADKSNWSIEGIELHMIKELSASAPRKVERLRVSVTVPHVVASHLTDTARAELEEAAHTCPVRLSLHPHIDVPLTFTWDS
jgi:putative redox protein